MMRPQQARPTSGRASASWPDHRRVGTGQVIASSDTTERDMAIETDIRQSEYQRALAENARYASQFDRSALPLPPGRRLAVLACMDARLTVEDVLGIRTGDAHIIRNAGGLATDDAIRSLVISQQLLGTDEVLIVEHTGCGMLTFQDDAVRADLAERTGTDVDIDFHAFPNLEENLKAQVERVKAHPWIKPDAEVHGLIFEVETGRVRPVA
jgi:carbonic anhydrase